MTSGALAYLHDERAAHFVLCKGKRPLWPGWQRRRPGLDVVMAHGPEIGLIPWSIGTSALDIDYGPIGELVEATGPLATLPSPGGFHAYYEDTQPRGNGRWAVLGCKGDIRSARGYLRLYEGGADRLASALRHTPAGTTAFPADLFAAAGLDPVKAVEVERPKRHAARPPADLPALADTWPGRRNIVLFDHLRFWAYPQDKGAALDAWAARVLRIALDMTAAMPRPLPQSEARSTAWSVASWTWAGGGPLDHSPAAQRRRGVKSGKARRARVADRDRAIAEMRDRGASWRAIARTFRIDVATAYRAGVRGKALREPNQGGMAAWTLFDEF